MEIWKLYNEYEEEYFKERPTQSQIDRVLIGWGKKPFPVKVGLNWDKRGMIMCLYPIYVVDNEPDLSGPMPVL
jgi:hypothetical protein